MPALELLNNKSKYVLEHSWFLNHFGYQNARQKTSYLYHIQLQGSVYVLHI